MFFRMQRYKNYCKTYRQSGVLLPKSINFAFVFTKGRNKQGSNMGNSLKSIFISLLAVVAASCGTYAQMRPNQSYQAYISQYKDIAIEQMLRE